MEDMRLSHHELAVLLLVVLVRSSLHDLDHQAADIGCASLLVRWPCLLFSPVYLQGVREKSPVQ